MHCGKIMRKDLLIKYCTNIVQYLGTKFIWITDWGK